MARKKANGSTETGEDQRLITALLSSPTIRQASAQAGVSEATVYRRLRDGAFSRELKEQRLRTYSHALQRLQMASESAVDVLEQAMLDEHAPVSSRIKAAVSVLRLTHTGEKPQAVDYLLKSDVDRMVDSLDAW